MRTSVTLVLMAGLLSLACRKKDTSSPATNTPSAGNPLTAPADYLGAAGRAKQSAEKTLSSAGIDQAVKMFHAQEGRLPRSLDELVPAYLRSLPPAPAGMKYSYDPKTGFVKVVPQ